MDQNRTSIFFHRTTPEDARSVIESGFKNGSGYFLSNRIWTGVWLSSVPIGSDHGAEGDALLMVELEIDDGELARWEWVAEGRTYREWLIPANILNKCATVELVERSSN